MPMTAMGSRAAGAAGRAGATPGALPMRYTRSRRALGCCHKRLGGRARPKSRASSSERLTLATESSPKLVNGASRSRASGAPGESRARNQSSRAAALIVAWAAPGAAQPWGARQRCRALTPPARQASRAAWRWTLPLDVLGKAWGANKARPETARPWVSVTRSRIAAPKAARVSPSFSRRSSTSATTIRRSSSPSSTANAATQPGRTARWVSCVVHSMSWG